MSTRQISKIEFSPEELKQFGETTQKLCQISARLDGLHIALSKEEQKFSKKSVRSIGSLSLRRLIMDTKDKLFRISRDLNENSIALMKMASKKGFWSAPSSSIEKSGSN